MNTFLLPTIGKTEHNKVNNLGQGFQTYEMNFQSMEIT